LKGNVVNFLDIHAQLKSLFPIYHYTDIV